MKLYKKLLVVALAAMPVAALQAQTYNDTVRTNTWTLYGAGGVSGYHGFRGGSDTGVHQAIAPDFNVGVKYNIKPWVRVGLNLGYTKIKALNKGIAHTQTVSNNYQIGDYNDGVLTVDKAVLVNRRDIHFAGADLNVDFNVLELFKNRNQRWNLWLGTGVGYYHAWNRGTLTTAISEEGVAQGPDHFNVYNRDYVTTQSESKGLNTLYVPARLSLEYDITPHWTAGVKGEYKCLPLNKDLTPKGMWSANLSIAYNFVGKRCQKAAHHCNDNREVIEQLNNTISQLRSDCNSCSDARSNLEAELKSAKDEIARLKAQQGNPQFIDTAIYFDHDKFVVKDSEMDKLAAVAKELKEYADLRIIVKGWASVEGDANHNIKLSENRAQAVADTFCNKFGISSDRISVSFGGPTNAIDTELARNRVVTVYVTK